jgi:hypothetical protein
LTPPEVNCAKNSLGCCWNHCISVVFMTYLTKIWSPLVLALMGWTDKSCMVEGLECEAM